MFHVEQKILHTPSMFGLLYQSMRPLRPRSVSTRCFNPRVCDGRDEVDGVLMHRHVVSIHASARDATGADDRIQSRRAVSIHASARDATDIVAPDTPLLLVSIHASARDATQRRGNLLSQSSFNPRVREGRDPTALYMWRSHKFQSTRPRGTRQAVCHASGGS